MPDWRIIEGGLADPRVIALVGRHVAGASANLPPEANHAAAIEGLKRPEIRFFAAWLDEQPLAIGALKRLGPGESEVKSMFTDPAARGKGGGDAILAHLIATARDEGCRRVSLATHPFDYFAAAIALYRRHGFAECPPYDNYEADPATLYMTRELN